MNFLIKKYPCSEPKSWAPVKWRQVQLGPDKTSFYNVKKYVNQYMTYLVKMQEQMMLEEQY